MHSGPARRRAVLVDFDWQDAEALVRLRAEATLTIRLVLGPAGESPSMKLAALSDLPRSSDVDMVTPAKYDIAIVSERSPRRREMEALFASLGIQARTPAQVLDAGSRGPVAGVVVPSARPPARAHDLARAIETEFLRRDPVSRLRRAEAPKESKPRIPVAGAQALRPELRGIAGLEAIPDPDDYEALARVLGMLMSHTGATHADLRIGRNENLETMVEIGRADLMTETLTELAVRNRHELVVQVVAGRDSARVFGAWPIVTPGFFAIMNAGGIDPARPWEAWRALGEEMERCWSDGASGAGGAGASDAGPAEPPPETRGRWMPPEDFRRYLDQVLELNRRDGRRFSLHRYRFAAPYPVLEDLFELLPRNLRGGDVLCRPCGNTFLLLTGSAPAAFFRLNQRILHLWEGCWRMRLDDAADPRVDIETVELASPGGGTAFLARADAWLTPASR